MTCLMGLLVPPLKFIGTLDRAFWRDINFNVEALKHGIKSFVR